MARYTTDPRYDGGGSVNSTDRIDNDRIVIVPDNNSQIDQVTAPQATADQNNYALPPGELIRLSTDASRNFTGFSGARPGIFAIVNVGTVAGRDVVIVNDSGGSAAENRVLCHTGGNITLNISESVFIVYDFASSRWRTVGFS